MISFIKIATALLLLHVVSSKRSVTELIEDEGYKVSQENVLTEDHHKINMYRVTNKNLTKVKDVVMLLPGVTTSSHVWVVDRNKSLAYYLADHGYEIWMVDLRGQSPEASSLKSQVLGPKKWRYTQDDMAKYDMPTSIDYVRNQSGVDKIHIVGYSQGNTCIFQVLSLLPEYNDKVKSFTALGPAVYLRRNTGPTKFFNLIPILGRVAAVVVYILGIFIGLVPLYASYNMHVISFLSRRSHLLQKFFIGTSQIFLGKDPDIDPKLYDRIYSRKTPAPVFALMQYYQTSRSGKFAKFSYGRFINLFVYGRLSPPVYDLAKIKVPVLYMPGKTDGYQTQENADEVAKLLEEGGSLYKNFPIKSKYMNHLGYVANKDVLEAVNKPILRFINKMRKGKKNASKINK